MVGIGDVFVLAGQSNAAGRADNYQVFNSVFDIQATMFTRQNHWMQLQDNLLTDVQMKDVAFGSHWTLLASQIVDYTGVPVAFIPTGYGAQPIDQWNEFNPLNRHMRQQIINSETQSLFILWHQGESDVLNSALACILYYRFIDACPSGRNRVR